MYKIKLQRIVESLEYVPVQEDIDGVHNDTNCCNYWTKEEEPRVNQCHNSNDMPSFQTANGLGSALKV